MCHPCYNAMRAIKTMANKTESGKAALARLQEQDPEGWKAKVRGCRIVEAVGETGVASQTARRTAIHEMLTVLVQSLGVVEQGGAIWLKKNAFIKHQIDEEGMERPDAEALWATKSREPSAMNMPGDETRVAVMKAPETVVYRKREWSKQISSKVSIDSQSQASEAVRDVSNVGVGMAALSGPMFGDMTNVLRPGVAAGSNTGQVLPLTALQAPPSQLVVPSDAFDGPVPKAKRTLGPTASCPDEEPEDISRPRRGGAALAGVTGGLLQLRKDGLEACSRLWETFGKQGKNVAKQLEARMRSAGGRDLPADVRETITAYTASLARVKEVEKNIKTWTQETAVGQLQELQGIAETLEAGHVLLCEASAADKVKKEQDRKNAARTRNETNKKRARLTSVYKGSAPDTLIRFLFEKGALVNTASAASDQEGDGSDNEGGSHGRLEYRWPVVTIQDSDFRHDRPAFFPVPSVGDEEKDCIAKQLRGLVGHLGEKRVVSAEQECARAISWAGASAQVSKRLEPKGQPQDSLEIMEWVPEHWRAAKQMPEALRGMGAPQLLVSMTGECRLGHDNWALSGIGQFITGVTGDHIVVAWPGDSVMSLGCAISDMYKFLFKDLGHKPFGEWADEHLRYVHLQQRSSVWIPYGWYAALLTRPGEHSASAALSQPYVTQALASKCAWWPSVSEHLLTVVAAFMEKGKPKCWREIGPATIEWLKVHANEASFPQAALQDVSAETQPRGQGDGGKNEKEADFDESLDLNDLV